MKDWIGEKTPVASISRSASCRGGNRQKPGCAIALSVRRRGRRRPSDRSAYRRRVNSGPWTFPADVCHPCYASCRFPFDLDASTGQAGHTTTHSFTQDRHSLLAASLGGSTRPWKTSPRYSDNQWHCPTEGRSLGGDREMTIWRQFPYDMRHIRLDRRLKCPVGHTGVAGMILAGVNIIPALAMFLIFQSESRVYRVMWLKYSW